MGAAPGMSRSLLSRVAAATGPLASRDRECVDIGSFRLLLHAADPSRAANVAVPVGRPAGGDWRREAQALRDAFHQRQRQPRVEYFEELWPGLTEGLMLGGMTTEMRAPTLARQLRGGDPWFSVSVGEEPRVLLLRPEHSDELLAEFLRVTAAIFDLEEPLDSEIELARLRDDLRSGRSLIALIRIDDRVAACGGLDRRDPVAELVGIGTLPWARRQGLAGRLCAALLAEAERIGLDLIWLGANSPDALSLYGRLGFRAIGHQVLMRGDPPPR